MRCGARAAVVVTSGFAEMGDDGARLQRGADPGRAGARHQGRRTQLPRPARQPAGRAALDATFGGRPPPAGGLAVASQSGRRRHRACIGPRDASASASGTSSRSATRPTSRATTCLPRGSTTRTSRAAALYLESFGNSAKFARVARRFSERKPLLAVVGGRSGGGQRAGASHTAAAATPAVRVDALFAQAGVIGCRDAEELAETALLLEGQTAARGGPRSPSWANAGGLGVLAADALSD